MTLTSLFPFARRPDVTIEWREVQRFWQNKFVLGVAAVVTIASIVGTGALALSGEVDDALAASPLAGIAVIAVAITMGLITELRQDAVKVWLWPLFWRTVRYEDIVEAEARQYNPLTEYGGWGMRWGISGQAWNVSGRYGVQLVLRDGRRVLIGSRESEELARRIRAHIGQS
jgi:hypothetical protein